MLDVAAEVEVIGAALADHDVAAGSVDLGVVGERRVVAHQVGAFDEHVGGGEGNAGATARVDGEEADVGPFLGDGGHGLGRHFHGDQFQVQAQQAGEGACQVDRHAGGLVAVGLPPGQHGIAQVDDGAQFAGGGDFGNQGGVVDGIGGHGGSPVCTAMRFRELSRRAAPGQGWFPRR